MTNENDASIVVLVGLPASGKSTARAKAVSTGASANSYQYSTDDIVERTAKAAGVEYDEIFADYISAATAEANAEVKDAVKDGRSVLWDQTNMSRKKRAKVLNVFTKDYRKECICILPPHTADQQIELEHRLASRKGKQIPKFVMANMLKSFQLPMLDEGFSRVLYFDIYGVMVGTEHAIELFPDATD